MCNIWCHSFAKKLPPLLPNSPKILEAGARIVNGSVKEYFDLGQSGTYVGIDIEPGDGVDFVLDVVDLHKKFSAESFDAVVSTEMLEHCKDWRESTSQMFRVVKPGGFLLITTRSPGFDLHGYPGDYFRFTQDDMKEIFRDVGEIVQLEIDSTLDFPCGIGVIVKRTASSAELAAWAEGLVHIEVSPADAVIFTKGKEGLSFEERENLIISYFTNLVSNREDEIRRLNEGIMSQSEWSLNLADEVKKRDEEILRLQASIQEVSDWANSLSTDLEISNKEILRLQKLT